MAKASADELNRRVVEQLAAHPSGLTTSSLFQRLGHLTSRRTLERRLAALLASRRITVAAVGRQRLYRPCAPLEAPAPQPPSTRTPSESRAPGLVPYSSAGREIAIYVRAPIPQRKPVGYVVDLLEQYEPGQTHYLDAAAREHLAQIGRAPSPDLPPGTYARDLLGRLLIDLSWASSRLEGNTYNRLDTRRLIEFGDVAEGKDRTEAQMILNHKSAIEMLIENAAAIDFNAFTFRNLHALLADNLLADPKEGGRLRTRVVDITGTVFHPLGIPQQIESHFGLILRKARSITDVFEQSFFIMVHIPYLQPFIDVNKRVSRLGANISLIKHNFCPLSFVDVPRDAYVEGTLGIYELGRVDLLRDVFLWAYERSCQRYAVLKQTVAEPDPIRFRHRSALITIVAEIVRSKLKPDIPTVARVAARLVPTEDLGRVVELAAEDLDDLHPGNISRYRLRLSEYEAWRAG